MAPGLAKQSMQNGNASHDHLQPDDDDLLYEEELLRNPYSLKMWWRYLEARRDAPARKRYILYERALKALPVSYKVSCFRSLKMSASYRLPSHKHKGLHNVYNVVCAEDFLFSGPEGTRSHVLQ